MFPAAVGHDPPDRLRPGRLRLALGAAGLHDQEQAAFRRKERGTDRHLPAHAARDQPDPGTRVRAQRQPQRGLLQIPPRLRHPLRRTQPGTRPPYRRPEPVRFRGNPARPVLFVPRRLHRSPAAARLGPLGPTFSFTIATRSSPAPAGRRTTGRFTAIRSGDTSESRPATPKPASRPSNGCWSGSDKSRPGPPSMPRRPIPWATTTGRTATTGWRKNTTPSRRSPTSKTPRRKTARSSPWRNSTSITRIIRGPTNTPSRPSRTPFAATCSSGSCG